MRGSFKYTSLLFSIIVTAKFSQHFQNINRLRLWKYISLTYNIKIGYQHSVILIPPSYK